MVSIGVVFWRKHRSSLKSTFRVIRDGLFTQSGGLVNRLFLVVTLAQYLIAQQPQPQNPFPAPGTNPTQVTSPEAAPAPASVKPSPAKPTPTKPATPAGAGAVAA